MKHLFRFAAVVLCIFSCAQAIAFYHGKAQSNGSEVVPNFMFAEQPFLNLMKSQAGPWTSGGPTSVDSNGYPLPGNTTQSNVDVPGNAVIKGGSFIISATGQGAVGFGAPGVGVTVVGCSGAAGGGSCDNTGCSSFTASIAGKLLTVTAAPTGSGCSLVTGLPIVGAGIAATKFGVPLFIIGSSTKNAGSCSPSCTGAGGTGTYALNMSLSIGSESMTMGMRVEFTLGSGSDDVDINLQAGITSTQAGNPIQNYSLVLGTDEAAYWTSVNPCGSGQACIIGTQFKARMQQGAWSVMRDLNFLNGNITFCSTWDTRKPLNYYSYLASELRNAASGTTTYVAGGQTYTIPKPGQYITAGGTGASGGTVSYNAGTDTYSITVNTGNFVDKQTLEVLIPATGTVNSKMSMNGNTAVPLFTNFSFAPLFAAPTSGQFITMMYDQDINALITQSTSNTGIDCYMPPEAFIELAAELNVTPWHVLPYFALDPMTDWTTQFATYLKANYSPPHSAAIAGPIFELQNEIFNCIGTNGPWYLTAKSIAHIAADANHAWTTQTRCGNAGGSTSGELGKMTSTAGQDLTAIYGSAVEILVPEQTVFTGPWSDSLLTTAYLGQSMAAQTGYSKTIPAYKVATRLSVNNYWNTGYNSVNGTEGTEVGLGYCYFNYSISAGCQALYASQQAVMDVKMNSALLNLTVAITNLPTLNTNLAAWKTIGQNCYSGSRPAGCTINSTTPLMMYEGGYSEFALGSDVTQSISSASNAANAVLTTVDNDGCVAGMPVNLSGMTGGTWSGAAGNYTVVSATATTCTINLNSSGLGTLSGGTLTYTGAADWVTYLRNWTYLQPAMQTLTTTSFGIITANGAVNPSQFVLAGAFGTQGSWYLDNPNNSLQPGYPIASCTACTISGTSMTLSGTISGIFANGMVISAVSPGGNTVATGSTVTGCTLHGSGPCGSNATDILTLSASSTAANATSMKGSIPPTVISGGPGTISPVTAFKAFCDWNQNSAMCQ